MKNLFHRTNSDRGFTLVEVIVSIGFLCVACGIIIQLFIASGEVRSKAALREAAVLKASNAVEACMISDSPANVGMEIFNQEYTDYSEDENGYIIREYFGENWANPVQGEMPVYVLVVRITEIDRYADAAVGFGDYSGSSDVIISALYNIHVTAGYVDTGRDDSILAEFTTAKHYVYKGDGD